MTFDLDSRWEESVVPFLSFSIESFQSYFKLTSPSIHLARFHIIFHDASSVSHSQEEKEDNEDLTRQLSKANTEIQQLRTKMEMDTMKHAEETEEMKKKMMRQTAESEDQIEAAQARAHATEKQKHKVQMDLEGINKELEIANNNTLSADRRIKELEKQISG